MNSKMLRFIGIAVAAALVFGMWGGMAWWKIESKKTAAEAEATTAAPMTETTTEQRPLPEVLKAAAPAKVFEEGECADVWLDYWEYIDEGELDKLLETHPQVDWHGQPLSAAKGESPVGFSTFDDIDRDGMNELLICDGAYAAGESDWRTVLVFKYDTETKEVRYCGAIYGFGSLYMLTENGLLVNCESESGGYYSYYSLEDYKLVKCFTLAAKGDGTADFLLRVVDTDQGWTVQKDAYQKEMTEITFQTDLSEDDLAIYEATKD